ncbi:Uncharacterised protein [Mycobacterium tuberculosis]|nr:Uncharacterised protein [Mycobacterium tuberculosis]
MVCFIGSWNSAMSSSASSWSQCGKNSRAAANACRGVASSGYFWLSRTKQIRPSTWAFSYGCSPNTFTLPDDSKFCAVRIDMSVVFPAPLRPRSP